MYFCGEAVLQERTKSDTMDKNYRIRIQEKT